MIDKFKILLVIIIVVINKNFLCIFSIRLNHSLFFTSSFYIHICKRFNHFIVMYIIFSLNDLVLFFHGD
jgi:hypothetical protein